jgi:hypothetical protein
VALSAVVIACAFAVRGMAGWTYADIEAIAGEVYRRAPTHRDVQARVRAHANVAPALAVFAPPDTPGGGPGEDLVILLAPKAIAPPPSPGLTTVDRGASVAVIAEVRPFLDRTQATYCFAPRLAAPGEGRCADAGVGRAPTAPETGEDLAYPVLAAVREAFPEEELRRFGTLRQTIAIAVRTAPGPAHVVELLDERMGYRIENVTGVRFRGALPATRVVIEGGEGAGKIVLGREKAAPRSDEYAMPSLVEVPEDDAALLRLLDDPRVR